MFLRGELEVKFYGLELMLIEQDKPELNTQAVASETLLHINLLSF